MAMGNEINRTLINVLDASPDAKYTAAPSMEKPTRPATIKKNVFRPSAVCLDISEI